MHIVASIDPRSYSLMPAFSLSLRLDSARTQIDTLSERHRIARVAAVVARSRTQDVAVQIGESRQCQYVAASYAQDGEFRESLVVRVRGYGSSETLERRADRMYTRPFTRVSLDAPLFGHILVVLSQWTRCPRLEVFHVEPSRLIHVELD